MPCNRLGCMPHAAPRVPASATCPCVSARHRDSGWENSTERRVTKDQDVNNVKAAVQKSHLWILRAGPLFSSGTLAVLKGYCFYQAEDFFMSDMQYLHLFLISRYICPK